MSYYGPENAYNAIMQSPDPNQLIYRMSIIERTRQEIHDMKERMSRKERLLALLEKNPEFNEILDLLGS